MRRPLNDSWPYGLECDHEAALATAWDRDEADGIDPESEGSLYSTLDAEPKQFTDETAEVTVSLITGGVHVAWTCPVCGERVEHEFDASDFADDRGDD